MLLSAAVDDIKAKKTPPPPSPPPPSKSSPPPPSKKAEIDAILESIAAKKGRKLQGADVISAISAPGLCCAMHEIENQHL